MVYSDLFGQGGVEFSVFRNLRQIHASEKRVKIRYFAIFMEAIGYTLKTSAAAALGKMAACARIIHPWASVESWRGLPIIQGTY